MQKPQFARIFTNTPPTIIKRNRTFDNSENEDALKVEMD
jgi:hypothetical protein